MSKPDMLLWLSDARGQYIPRDFAKSFVDRDKHVSGVSADDWQTLENGPDDEWYWEAWTSVCDNATVTDENGVEYSIWQEGDCWLVPKGMEWSDRDETFHWPDDVLWHVRSYANEYWSNEQGWIENESGADEFTVTEKETFNLPIGGFWKEAS